MQRLSTMGELLLVSDELNISVDEILEELEINPKEYIINEEEIKEKLLFNGLFIDIIRNYYFNEEDEDSYQSSDIITEETLINRMFPIYK